MKIKANISGPKPADGEKTTLPEVIPITPEAAPRRTRSRGCLSQWTCCDWTLVSFIILFSGAVAFLTVAGNYRHQMEDYVFEYQMKEDRTHAECKVVHVQEHGLRSCMSCKNGMQGDQLEHGWWDWMENSTDQGWQENGFYMMPGMHRTCPEFAKFEKEAWARFRRETAKMSKREIEEAKKRLMHILKEKFRAMCEKREDEDMDFTELPKELLEGMEALDDDWEKKAWEDWEKTLEKGLTDDEIAAQKEMFKAKVEERRRGMCRHFMEMEKKIWEKFSKWAEGKPKELVEKVKRHLERFLEMKKRRMCGRKEEEEHVIPADQAEEETELPEELTKDLEMLKEDWEEKAWEEWLKTMEGKQEDQEYAEEKKKFYDEIQERKRGMCKRFLEMEKKILQKFKKWAQGKPKEMVEKVWKRLEKFLAMKKKRFCGRKEEEHMEGDDIKEVNKGNMASAASSQFPCHEIIVEVNPKGMHMNWTNEEENHWRGEQGSHEGSSSEESSEEEERHRGDHHHGPPRHHPHQGGRPGEPMHEPEEDMAGKMKDMMKDGAGMMKNMEKLGHDFELTMQDMLKRGVHHATLYDSTYTKDNHKQCSVSICKGSLEQNKKCVGNYISEYKQMWTEGETFPCFFDKQDKSHVYELEPWQVQKQRDDRHHWAAKKCVKITCMGLMGVLCVLIFVFIVRRAKQCRRSARARAYDVTPVNQVNTDMIINTEKEKEAFGEKY